MRLRANSRVRWTSGSRTASALRSRRLYDLASSQCAASAPIGVSGPWSARRVAGGGDVPGDERGADFAAGQLVDQEHHGVLGVGERVRADQGQVAGVDRTVADPGAADGQGGARGGDGARRPLARAAGEHGGQDAQQGVVAPAGQRDGVLDQARPELLVRAEVGDRAADRQLRVQRVEELRQGAAAVDDLSLRRGQWRPLWTVHHHDRPPLLVLRLPAHRARLARRGTWEAATRTGCGDTTPERGQSAVVDSLREALWRAAANRRARLPRTSSLPPAEVDDAVQAVLRRAFEHLWEHGWLPYDVYEVVRRTRTSARCLPGGLAGAGGVPYPGVAPALAGAAGGDRGDGVVGRGPAARRPVGEQAHRAARRRRGRRGGGCWRC